MIVMGLFFRPLRRIWIHQMLECWVTSAFILALWIRLKQRTNSRRGNIAEGWTGLRQEGQGGAQHFPIRGPALQGKSFRSGIGLSMRQNLKAS
jgi:hypothetical protein